MRGGQFLVQQINQLNVAKYCCMDFRFFLAALLA